MADQSLLESSLRRAQRYFEAESLNGRRLGGLLVNMTGAQQDYNLRTLLQIAKLVVPDDLPDQRMTAMECKSSMLTWESANLENGPQSDCWLVGDRESQTRFQEIAATVARSLGRKDSWAWARHVFEIAQRRQPGTPLQASPWAPRGRTFIDLGLKDILDGFPPDWQRGLGKMLERAEPFAVTHIPEMFAASVAAIDIVLAADAGPSPTTKGDCIARSDSDRQPQSIATDLLAIANDPHASLSLDLYDRLTDLAYEALRAGAFPDKAEDLLARRKSLRTKHPKRHPLHKALHPIYRPKGKPYKNPPVVSWQYFWWEDVVQSLGLRPRLEALSDDWSWRKEVSKLADAIALEELPASKADSTDFAVNVPTVTTGGAGGSEGPEVAKPGRRRGRPQDTDPTVDRRVFDAWATKQYRRYEDLARTMDMKVMDVKRAIDRERKRRDRKAME